MRRVIGVARRMKCSPEKIFPILADYRVRHLEILPQPPFLWLQVREGGYGQGTRIQFAMKVLGRTQVSSANITEPVPGRTLREEMDRGGIVTTYHLEPQNDTTSVQISTEMNFKDGLIGRLQFWVTRKFLEPIYVRELQKLEDHLNPDLFSKNNRVLARDERRQSLTHSF